MLLYKEKKQESDIMKSNKEIDNMTIEELMELIKDSRNQTIMLERQIKELEELRKEEKPVRIENPKEAVSEKTVEISEGDDKEFQEEVDYYYSLLNFIEEDSINLDSIKDILPAKNKANYDNIILSIKMRLLKIIKEYKDMIEEGRGEISSDYLLDIKKEIINTQTKINLIKQSEEENSANTIVESMRNNLFFSLSPTGNISVIDDIAKDISNEAYDDFKILFNSIVDGTFKGIKRFSDNDHYSFMAKVSFNEARVLFDRVGKNDYVIIGAFIKKTTTGKSYKETLESNVKSYLAYKDNIVNNLDKEGFRKQSQKYEEELFTILNGNKEKNKQFEKGGNN